MAAEAETRIGRMFARCRAAGRKTFIAYITAGDPSAAHTAALVHALERGGADLIELGVPFSDPIADGPVIQRASDRALAAGMSVSRLLDIVRDVRRTSDVPLLLFSYMNPLLRYGFERIARDASDAGMDGVLLTDLPAEEAQGATSILRSHALDTVFLAAPTSGDARLRLIAEHSSGFVYLVSRLGITGEQVSVSTAAGRVAERLRRMTDCPLAVGFGIAMPEHVQEAWRIADAAVVGSAIVSRIERGRGCAPEELAHRVEEFVHQMLQAARGL